MKQLLTLSLILICASAFGQTTIAGDVVQDKQGKLHTTTASAAKADSLAAITPPPDTIAVDLRTFDAYSRLIQVDMQRQAVQSEALALKQRLELLDEKYNAILDAEVRHDPRFKGREIVGSPKIVGYNLVVLVKRLPCGKLPPGAKCVEMEDKKKKKP